MIEKTTNMARAHLRKLSHTLSAMLSDKIGIRRSYALEGEFFIHLLGRDICASNECHDFQNFTGCFVASHGASTSRLLKSAPTLQAVRALNSSKTSSGQVSLLMGDLER